MSRHLTRNTVTCRCCNKRGQHEAHGLIGSCYDRWRKAGRPDIVPPPAKTSCTWIPDQHQALTKLVRFGRLVTAGATEEKIRKTLRLGERQYDRYAAAWRNLHALAGAAA